VSVIGVFEIVSAFLIRKAGKTVTDADRAVLATLAA